MKKPALVILLTLAAPALAQSDPKQAPTKFVRARQGRRRQDRPAAALAEARQDAKVLVVAFNSADCPCRSSIARSSSGSRRSTRRRTIRFLIVATDDTVFAPILEPTRSTETFVLDADGVLRYRGAIDDQYGIGYHRDEPTRTYVTDAIEAVLAGQRARRSWRPRRPAAASSARTLRRPQPTPGHVPQRTSSRSSRAAATTATGRARSGPSRSSSYGKAKAQLAISGAS